MAWEWSYSHEGIDNIRQNIMDMDTETAIVALAEHQALASREDYANGFNSAEYDRSLARLNADLETLGESFGEMIKMELFDQASEIATCENGGFNVWACPFGCHTVSASRDDDQE